MRLGVPELGVMFFMLALWALPLAAGVWALVTLARIRRQQDEILSRLDVLARSGTTRQA